MTRPPSGAPPPTVAKLAGTEVPLERLARNLELAADVVAEPVSEALAARLRAAASSVPRG
jgi:hypothetical protein